MASGNGQGGSRLGGQRFELGLELGVPFLTVTKDGEIAIAVQTSVLFVQRQRKLELYVASTSVLGSNK